MDGIEIIVGFLTLCSVCIGARGIVIYNKGKALLKAVSMAMDELDDFFKILAEIIDDNEVTVDEIKKALEAGKPLIRTIRAFKSLL